MYKLEIKPAETLKTPWGTAKVDKLGYYRITSRKEGNNMKYLHRLIWERWYGEIPPHTHIHHIDGNKLNNCIWNLESISAGEHSKLHNTGENHPMYGKTGEKCPNWKPYARVIKGSFTSNGKRQWTLRYNGKNIKYSIHKEKLEKEAHEINSKEEKEE